ncbi:hypothetical protein [Streptomyces megasporus]|uniref:hypothetical protein n=1 Tax=Streptomyces megasporus TaxID=44060 RepID=UPI0004E1284B|nr:hypothetical protein [Streptomyces megasporus]
MTKGRGLAIVGYSALTLLCAAATAFAVFDGLARLDLLGNAVQVWIAECHVETGGRGGSYSVCSGPRLDIAATHIVEVRYEGHRGEVIRVARTPWGSHEAVDTGFVSWGIAVLLPVLPLMATAAAGAFTVREVRRARRDAMSDGAP